jgi:ribosomal protein S18 acetylase RimI-like enzyme
MIGVVDVIPQGFTGKSNLAFISLLMLAAPFRQKGLGTKILKQVEAYLRQDNPGLTEIWTAVQVNNPAAFRFWQRNGYHIVKGPEPQPDGTIVYYFQKVYFNEEPDLPGKI